MSFKKIKPTTPARRHLVLVNKTLVVQKTKPIKKLTKGLSKQSGRNNYGRITVRHKGGGHKRKYRLIEFKREKKDAIVTNIEYDPNRTVFLARIKDSKGNESYILAPKDLKKGMKISCQEETPIQVGNAMFLKNIPIGSLIHNLSIHPNRNGQYIRSAGTYGQLVQKTSRFARVKLSSGEHRSFPLDSFATLGILSNENHMHEKLGKAGRSRWKGIRPSVRGVAMNPVDHPHGGGEGKTGTKRPPVSPWAKLTKGQPTRKKKKKNLYIIQFRKK